ncbi:MAG: hypothetical protein IIZ45_05210 [Firmicutes bacterium]|jgi:hypothetical protein|nr:hypothetical protein [Bacillota bacterium]
MDKETEAAYQAKIRRLEEENAGLRASRRLMMTLFEQGQAAGKAEQERLRSENRRLARELAARSRDLWRSRTKRLLQG